MTNLNTHLDQANLKRRPKMSISGYILISLAGIILLAILISLILQGLKIFSKISDNFDALKFTYNHPQMVRSIEQQYASASAQLEYSFEKHSPSPNDQLIEAVTASLQSSKP